MELTIFYSWQAKTDSKKNRYYIKNCIEKAYKMIQKETPSISFKLLESVNKESGSPAVASTIMDERIPNCDIFVADLSVTDPYSKLEILKNKFHKKKCRDVHQANNVMIEYGIAYKSIGKECIIGVLNSEYGSPNDNSDNIPFDIKHLRFPIEYQHQRESKSFITGLKDAIYSCTKTAIEQRKNKFLPFQSFYEYRNNATFQSDFYDNNVIEAISKRIRDTEQDIRFLGLSGLGKTRITFESFKNINEDALFNWLYCDYQLSEETKITESLNKLFNDTKNCYIIVIDNCHLAFFRKVLQLKFEKGNKSKIISIYNQPEEEYYNKINSVDYITLSINDLDSVVDKIIKSRFPYFNEPQQKTIKEFSEGIPLMAVLLAENMKTENNMGLLSDKELLDKLLSFENEIEKEILKSCSLFKYIGYEEEMKKQVDYIVTNSNITPISGDNASKLSSFEKVFLKYKRREIFEVNGRFFSIRPRPLALYLAEEWINQCLQDRIVRIVEEMKDADNVIGRSLVEPLCQQIKYLGYNSKAQYIIENLTKANAPFHNAEVINTELGSRLFRSFVEVNPVAVADCLWSVFGGITTKQLQQIEEGRRNLVWTLEKLCFDIRTYEKGMKLMLMFGSAENETLGNNATNEFIRLFKIYLPGTQASLFERLEILKWGIGQAQYKELSLKALKSALDTIHFSYMCGAERQGIKHLDHYQPSTNEEIFKYWNGCLNLIQSEILSDSPYSQLCEEIIEDCVAGICRSGAGHIILPIIKAICEKKIYDWEEMLDSLWWIKNHAHLNPDMLNEVSRMIDALTKTDFVSRFKEVGNKNRDHGNDLKFAERIAKQKELYEQLANEFVKAEINKTDTLMQLYQIDNNYTHPFGYTIAKLFDGDSDKTHWFINTSIECFHSLNNFYPSLLFDFARGISEDAYDYLVSTLMTDDKCSFLLFPIMANHGVSLSQTQSLFELVKNKKVPVEHLLNYWRYSIVIPSSSEKEIIDFFSKVIECNDNGFNIVISMLNNLLFFNKEKECSKIIDYIISEFLHRNNNPSVFLLNNDYLEIINHILSHYHRADLAKFINQIIIELSQSPDCHLSSDYRVEHLYSTLLDNYFSDIAQNLLPALISNNPFTSLAFQFLLAPKEYGDLSHKLFQEKNIEIILDFCEQESVAQERIMRIVPAIQDGQFSPFVISLLDKYGNNTDMLSSLGANIGSFSFVGSLIPLYESRKKTISTLLNHFNPTVVDWAKHQLNQLDRDIALEKQKEAEDKFFYS